MIKLDTRQDLIKEYVNFFKKKSHKHIPSSSLIPEHDPTVLFTTAGMHPLVPYLLGQKHPLGKRLVSVQKCLRTDDIDEVGDSYHHTFFEMLGNWSLGDYFKKESIKMSFEFLTQTLKLPKENLAVSVFKGDKDSSKDNETAEIWLSLGIPKERIAFLPKKNNWWPTPKPNQTGPCGPDTEIFFWRSSENAPKKFNPDDDNWVEIWNNVFIQYNKTSSGYNSLKQKDVDTGMGVERTLAILQNLDDDYLTSCFLPIIKNIENLSNKTYEKNKRKMRILADHIKAAVFILGDEHAIKPSNIGQGYILRRLIRRAIRYGKILGMKEDFLPELAKSVFPIYPDYQELHKNHKFILEQLKLEEEKFVKTLEKGLKKFNKMANDKIITGKEAFLLFQSYGFPIEMTTELAEEKGIKIDLEEYNKEFKHHQDISRASQNVFKSGLANDSEETKKLHTATHILNESLRKILGKNIKQKGSNITPERLRFDFNFPRKLTPEELKKIESLVNEKIDAALPITREEIPLEQAISSGAQAEFGTKYPELVSVYTIGSGKNQFSREICTGPHVLNTKELGKFKIIKESSVAAGIRRIKAILE